MLFDHGEFGFVLHHAKVETFKVEVGNVVHNSLVAEAAKNSHNNFVALRLSSHPIDSRLVAVLLMAVRGAVGPLPVGR